MAWTKAGNAKVIVRDSGIGWILFTAYVGALIYFIQRAEGILEVVLAFLQAAVWPAYVLHAVLKLLNI
jgi:hypothetical protein